MKCVLIVLTLQMLLFGAPVSAHHSRVAEFDETKPVKLEGVLQKFDWVNPHGWIYLEVKGAGGVETWAIETEGASALFRRGLRKTDFPAGLKLSVEGFLARKLPRTAVGTRMLLPDGTELRAASGRTN